MGLIADFKLLQQLKKMEKQAGTEHTSNNPLVHIFGAEKSFGKPAPHDFSKFVANFDSWAFAAAYKNAFSVAAMKLRLFKKVQGDKPGTTALEEINEHPFIDLTRNVNPYYNYFELKALTSLSMDVTGNAYWWIIKNPLGVPSLIWNLPAQWMRVVPSKDKFVEGYLMTVPGRGDKVPFEADEIIHFKFPSIFSIYYGTPPMFGAGLEIGLNKNLKIFGNNFLLNGAQPSGVLTADDAINSDMIKRLQTMWKLRHQGPNNAGKIAILEGGLKYQKIGSNIGELKMDKSSKGIRDAILAMFGVPSSKLGLSEDVNRANAEANDATYQKETIQPRLKLIEE